LALSIPDEVIPETCCRVL